MEWSGDGVEVDEALGVADGCGGKWMNGCGKKWVRHKRGWTRLRQGEQGSPNLHLSSVWEFQVALKGLLRLLKPFFPEAEKAWEKLTLLEEFACNNFFEDSWRMVSISGNMNYRHLRDVLRCREWWLAYLCRIHSPRGMAWSGWR